MMTDYKPPMWQVWSVGQAGYERAEGPPYEERRNALIARDGMAQASQARGRREHFYVTHPHVEVYVEWGDDE